MIVAVAALAAQAVVALGFLGYLRSERRAYARREDLLIAQLLHTVGKPWTPAPASKREPLERDPNLLLDVPYTPAPEQLPVQ